MSRHTTNLVTDLNNALEHLSPSIEASMEANLVAIYLNLAMVLFWAMVLFYFAKKVLPGDGLERFVGCYVYIIIGVYTCATLLLPTLLTAPPICPLHIHPDAFAIWSCDVATWLTHLTVTLMKALAAVELTIYLVKTAKNNMIMTLLAMATVAPFVIYKVHDNNSIWH